MLKSLASRIFAALGASLLLSAGPAQARTPAPAHPALWAVADADTTVYLFGTIHLLPAKYKWRTPTFDQAVDGSQQLVVETIVVLCVMTFFTLMITGLDAVFAAGFNAILFGNR